MGVCDCARQVGIGLTPEAIEQNPLVYELMLDNVWRSGPITDLDAWTAAYLRRRYGADKSLAEGGREEGERKCASKSWWGRDIKRRGVAERFPRHTPSILLCGTKSGPQGEA